ncbi:hypothetical protein pb186bvf_019535 [Paramecium bursaria]
MNFNIFITNNLEWSPDQDVQESKILSNGSIVLLVIRGQFQNEEQATNCNIKFLYNLQKNKEQLPLYQSFSISNIRINDNQNNKIILKQNFIYWLNFVQICQYMNEQSSVYNLQVELQIQQQQYKIDKDNFIKTLLHQPIEIVNNKKEKVLLDYQFTLNNTLQFEYEFAQQYNSALINYKIPQDVNISDISFMISESKAVWQDQQLNREASSKVLDYIFIERQHYENNEGFIQLKLDWPQMLKDENGSNVNIPSRRQSISQKLVNPQLQLQTPLYISIKQDNYNVVLRNNINWNLKAINQIGAEITEAIRFQLAQQEYLAIKLKVTNYSTKKLKVTFVPPNQIFGQKLKNNTETIVLGIILTKEKDLGTIQPSSQQEALIRVQLINKGVLNMRELQFKVDDNQVILPIQFMHSYT